MNLQFSTPVESPERIIPPALRSHNFATPIWCKQHPSGALLVVFQLKPLRHFVAGWLTNLGWKTSPRLVGGFIADDSVGLDKLIDDLGQAAFQRGPSPEVVLRALEISAEYAKNGLMRGKSKKKGAVEGDGSVRDWRKDYPGLHFSTHGGRVTLKSRTQWAFVFALCDPEEWRGKGLRDWNRIGPTKDMVRRLHDPKDPDDI
jgi:hypothetical protein